MTSRGTQLSTSVVINNHNYGRFLRQAIDSALSQTRPCEVVVVDDASDDGSSAIIMSYGTRITARFIAVRSQAAAINAGIAASSGEILMFLDSDDWIHADKSERVTAAFSGDPELLWLRHDMREVDESGALLRPLKYRFDPRSVPAVEILTLGRVLGSTSGLAFRRQLLAEIGPIPENCYERGGADLYLMTAGALRGGHLTLPDSLTSRRMHAGQFTRQSEFSPGAAQRELITQRCRAVHAAVLAERWAGSPTLARKRTWWQLKAICEYERHRSVLPWRRLWRAHLRSLAVARLPGVRKVSELSRSVLLGYVPRRLFLRMWWLTHTGRPALPEPLAQYESGVLLMRVGRGRKERQQAGNGERRKGLP
jgi:hypothetical protein